MGVPERTAQKIYQRAKDRAGCEDFNEILACAGDIERPGRLQRVPNSTVLSRDIRQAILKHSNLPPTTAVLDQENIDIPAAGSKRKRPSRSIIERIQHEHEHYDSEQDKVISELVRGRSAKKPRTDTDSNDVRKEFCSWALGKLKEGAIFIYSDKTYHEVGVKSGPENITQLKGAPAEDYTVPQSSIEFTIMQ